MGGRRLGSRANENCLLECLVQRTKDRRYGTAVSAAGKAMDAIGRNPEASSKIQTSMILAIAFAEAIAIYALVVALIIKFV